MAYALGYAGGYADLGEPEPEPVVTGAAGGPRTPPAGWDIVRRKIVISQRLIWTVRKPVDVDARLAWTVTPKKEPVTAAVELRWRAHRESEELWLLGLTEAP